MTESENGRPWWMTALAWVCLGALLINVPRDLFFAETREVEVGFGFEVRGPAALVTAPLHWAIFAVGAWAFWFERRWVVPWAAAYVFYVALSHLVWSEVSPNGRGWPVGAAQAFGISLFGFALLHAGRRLPRNRSGQPARAPAGGGAA